MPHPFCGPTHLCPKRWQVTTAHILPFDPLEQIPDAFVRESGPKNIVSTTHTIDRISSLWRDRSSTCSRLAQRGQALVVSVKEREHHADAASQHRSLASGRDMCRFNAGADPGRRSRGRRVAPSCERKSFITWP